jgi:hypothetical protein
MDDVVRLFDTFVKIRARPNLGMGCGGMNKAEAPASN